jgi:hypothetical protein
MIETPHQDFDSELEPLVDPERCDEGRAIYTHRPKAAFQPLLLERLSGRP